MSKLLQLKVLPHEANDPLFLKGLIAQSQKVPIDSVLGFHYVKKSLDARSRTIWIHLTLEVFLDEPYTPRSVGVFDWKIVQHASIQVIIIGAGPAGLFAALRAIELGIKPIILERGKDVRARRRDLAAMNKQGEVNPESNYCFGEGGAGTYSDGKLYTRSQKRGDVFRILEILHHFGAKEDILYEAHPHIGTNKLPDIITRMREHILTCGGEIHFESKVVDLTTDGESLKFVTTADGSKWAGDGYILATGHSARDIFELLHRKDILIESKPFALGVRIEHPQELIDSCQYHMPYNKPSGNEPARGKYLPPASYSLVLQAIGRGVFSFCMCPGGIIAPAATAPGEIVVNGWSPSKRNNPYANSGLVTEIRIEDLAYSEAYKKVLGIDKRQLHSPLGMMYFQQVVEKNAFVAGGGKLVAPSQRLDDFIRKKVSTTLPDCSYLPGIHSTDLYEVLPGFVSNALREGLKAFGKKMHGYHTNEAVLVATESRTSSPVRIPRLADKLHHLQIKNLYPCAEGAGYAGGIVSAAMDGVKVVNAIRIKV